LPPWLNITHDPLSHTIKWSTTDAPLVLAESYKVTVIGKLDSEFGFASNQTALNLLIFPFQPLPIFYADEKILTYRVGDPATTFHFDPEIAAFCTKLLQDC
jgi:hypothetical protein